MSPSESKGIQVSQSESRVKPGEALPLPQASYPTLVGLIGIYYRLPVAVVTNIAAITLNPFILRGGDALIRGGCLNSGWGLL